MIMFIIDRSVLKELRKEKQCWQRQIDRKQQKIQKKRQKKNRLLLLKNKKVIGKRLVVFQVEELEKKLRKRFIPNTEIAQVKEKYIKSELVRQRLSRKKREKKRKYYPLHPI